MGAGSSLSRSPGSGADRRDLDRRDQGHPGRAGGGERFYRALLRAYPEPFRVRFADEMVQLFSDQMRDAREADARSGVARTWFRILGDLAVTSIEEHTREDRPMAHSLAERPSPLTRILGVLGILGGLLIVAAFVPWIPWGTLDNFNLRLTAFNLGAIAIVLATYRRQSADSPRLALVGAVPAVLANAWYLVMVLRVVSLPGDPGPGDYGFWFDVVASAMWLGDAWFGFVLARIGGGSRVIALALGIGSVLAWGGLSRFGLVSGDAGAIFGPLSLLGIGLNGLAWIALGIGLVRGRRRPAATA